MSTTHQTHEKRRKTISALWFQAAHFQNMALDLHRQADARELGHETTDAIEALRLTAEIYSDRGLELNAISAEMSAAMVGGFTF